MATRRPSLLLLLAALVSFSSQYTVDAFHVGLQQRQRQFQATSTRGWNAKTVRSMLPSLLQPQLQQRKPATSLNMYNLPPSNNNNDNMLKDALISGLVLVGIIAFFASPLGALFFAFFNSLFLLSIVLPVVGFTAFFIWQYFNTIQGPCPNCGAPVRVLKHGSEIEDLPNNSLCWSCGSVVQANRDNDGIELTTVFKEDEITSAASFWDTLFGGETIVVTDNTPKFQQTTTVIDVEVEEQDDEPPRKRKW